MKAYNRRKFLQILSGAGFLPLVPEILFSHTKFTHYVKIRTQLDAASFVAARLEFPQGFVIETKNDRVIPFDFSRYLSGDLNLNGVKCEPFELQAVINDILGYTQEHLLGYPRLSETDRILLDIDGDGVLTVFDALKGRIIDRIEAKLTIPRGTYLILPGVKITPADSGYLGITQSLSLGKNGTPVTGIVFKNEPIADEFMAKRYSNLADALGRLTNTDLETVVNTPNVPEPSKIRRWDKIKISYEDPSGGDYEFANINHSQKLRDAASYYNQQLGFTLFEEVALNDADVTFDFSTDNSKVDITLYDDKGNPLKAKVFKKKYCGAENWSKAESWRLLFELVLGNNLGEYYFPEERIAAEVLDQKVPDDVVNVMKSQYNLPKRFDITSVIDYEKKPSMIIKGDKVNSEILFEVKAPGNPTKVILEELVAEKDTREYWSGERILNQELSKSEGKYQGTFNWRWPGPRRLRVTAEYTDGSKTLEEDLLVKTDKEVGYLKSMNVLAFMSGMQPETDKYILSTLNRQKELGVNMITIHPEWYLDDRTKTDIHPLTGFHEGHSYTWPDELTSKVVNYAKDFGRKVMFRPNINVLTPGEWQGILQPENNDWDALFESHKNYLLYYAKLGQEFGVDYFSVGAELDSMCLPNWNGFGVPDPDSRWRNIIQEVRNVYDGKLTMSLGSNQYGHKDAVDGITWWDALDFIGFEPYFGLTGGEDPVNNGINDPSLIQLKDGFKYWAERTLIPTVEKFKKKVIITESGYYSFDGVNRNPTGVIGPMSEVGDFKEQADCYNVMLDYFKNNDVLEALNIWDGYIFDDATIALWYGSWDNVIASWTPPYFGQIYGLPSERVIQANWKK